MTSKKSNSALTPSSTYLSPMTMGKWQCQQLERSVLALTWAKSMHLLLYAKMGKAFYCQDENYAVSIASATRRLLSFNG
ncbi:hypothetical protein [Paenibacillus polymyxa]|uniref:hypothetical protein n=1 Tax=Paenibacillus polymyxa TaxID=1406 RepID=UPI002A74EB57|nr:hypothetical protein [Paenibacillus polymyxa]WPQ59683.1 hypothetical protein SKN87_28915 [Paenibacillus polymyxa]